MSKLSQGDIVHIEATVEHVIGDEVGVILKTAKADETRVRIPKTAIKHQEAGPIRAGDKVSKGTAKARKEGKVLHRDGDQAWVDFNGTHAIEAIGGLTRL